ncbi:MAG TPA: hypothetical protein VF762_05920 [Blastocatellia bacterium]|jgi:hypothetical protein
MKRITKILLWLLMCVTVAFAQRSDTTEKPAVVAILRPTKEQSLTIANMALQAQAKHSEARALEAEAKVLDEQLPRLIEDLKKIVCGKEADKYQAQVDKGQIIFVLKQEAEEIKSKRER